MLRRLIALLLLASPALAQEPQIDAQKVIDQLREQRNAAMDGLAVAQSQKNALTEQLAKLKAELEKLRDSQHYTK